MTTQLAKDVRKGSRAGRWTKEDLRQIRAELAEKPTKGSRRLVRPESWEAAKETP